MKKLLVFIKKLLKLDPSKPELIYNLGLACILFLENMKKAEALYKKAYSIIPNDDLLKKNYSILLLAKQKYKEAWNMFEGRIRLK